jgi:uncharacterized protein (UPF0371 family)
MLRTSDMLMMDVNLNGDNAWPDLQGKEDSIIELEKMIQVAVLDRGMTSGKPSVCFRLNLPDGKVVLAQTSARLFCTAAKMIMAKYPDLFEGE